MKKFSKDTYKKIGYVLIVLAAFIWGLESVLFKNALNSIDMYPLTLLRLAMSSIILTIYIECRKRYLKKKQIRSVYNLKKKRSKKYYALILGMSISLCLYNLLGMYGLNLTQANVSCFLSIGLDALLTSMFLAIFFKKERKQVLRSFTIISLLIALMGTYILAFGDGSSSIDYGVLLISLSTMAWAIYMLLYEFIDFKISAMEINRNVSTIGTIIFLIIIIAKGDLQTLFNLSLSNILEIVGVTLFVDIGTVFTYYIGIRIITGVKASVIILMSPFVSLLFSYLILGETLQGREEMGCLLLFLASTTAVVDEYIESQKKKKIDNKEAKQ